MIAIAIRLLAIFLMIAAGWRARRTELIGDATVRQLAQLLTGYFYPALIFAVITDNFTTASLRANWHLPVGAFAIMATGFVGGLLVERWLTDPHSRRGHAFLFQCAINNYSFLPLPLALLLWGERGVGLLVLSTLGAEVALWTLGVYAVSGRAFHLANLRRLLSPPLIAVAVALLVVLGRDALGGGTVAPAAGAGHWLAEAVAAVRTAIALFGKATIPVAMVIAGARMAELRLEHVFDKLQIAVVAMRLLVIPAVVILALGWLPVPLEARQVLVLVATMPSAVGGVILCELYGADSKFAATSILLTHLVALLTIPFWLAVAL